MTMTATRRMTTAELQVLPVTVDLLTAARAFGLGRTAAYELARTGAFPCRIFRAGKRYVVARGDLLHALGITETPV